MKILLLSTFILVNILSSIIFTKRKTSPPLDNGFAVVELFTSEGCSSCPPADDAVADIAKQYGNHVLVLGYHVDYWDHLGWKDAYSQAAFTERQKRYAGLFNLNSIYTPEVIINGKAEFVGSDRKRLKEEVQKALSKSSVEKLELNPEVTNQQNILVHYRTSLLSNQVLNIAIIDLSEQTKVTGGENAGRQLHHVDIVREFVSISNPRQEGSVSLTIPTGLTPGDCQIIAFEQDKNNWAVNAATKIDIQPLKH